MRRTEAHTAWLSEKVSVSKYALLVMLRSEAQLKFLKMKDAW